MTSRFKKIAAGFALTGFLLTGALAGVVYSQTTARANTTIGVVTLRSIISGALTFASGTTLQLADGTFSTVPSLTFASETGMGFGRLSSHQMGFMDSGGTRLLFTSTDLGLGAVQRLSWYSTNSADQGGADTLINRDGAAGTFKFSTTGTNLTIREYYGGGVDYTSRQTDSSINANFRSTYPDPTVASASAALNVISGHNCTAGAHTFKVSYLTAGGETLPSTVASGSVTCDGTHTTVALTSIATGASPRVTGRNVYATLAGGSTYFLVGSSPTINDDTTTTYTFDTADASLTVAAPTTNTAVDTTVTFAPTTGQILAYSGILGGTAAKPHYSWSGNTGYGMFFDSADTGIGFSINGTQNTLINTNGLYFNGGIHMPDSSALTWASSYLGSSDVTLGRRANGIVGVGDGTISQLMLEINGGGHSTVPTFDHGTVASHSTPTAGSITLTGGNTGGTLTFNNAFTNAPFCVVEDATTLQSIRVSSTTNATMVVASATANDTFYYVCLGGAN